MKNVGKWSETEINFLIKNYEYGDKHWISSLLNRDWKLISHKAFKLKLNRKVSNLIKSNCDRLIDGSNESYYWLGFIMADGSFNSSNQIRINLSVKDLEHLRTFCKYIGYDVNLKKPSVKVNYKSIKVWLEETFKISYRKTYEPCDLSKMKNDSLFSFIIGFIDGDGHISKRGCLCIKCHSTWLNNLIYMINELSYGVYNKGIINSEGLSYISLTSKEILFDIKLKIIKLGLPVLNRKWDRVTQSKRKEYRILSDEIFICFENGLLPKEVIIKYGKSSSFVYSLYQKWLNKFGQLK
jgi:hypothetical protein